MGTEEKDSEGKMDWNHYRPLAPTIFSVVAVIAWLVFILIYALQWSSGYSVFQNVVVTIVSLVITGLVIALGWIVWGMKRVPFWMRKGWS